MRPINNAAIATDAATELSGGVFRDGAQSPLSGTMQPHGQMTRSPQFSQIIEPSRSQNRPGVAVLSSQPSSVA